jgi:hypothetical protein
MILSFHNSVNSCANGFPMAQCSCRFVLKVIYIHYLFLSKIDFHGAKISVMNCVSYDFCYKDNSADKYTMMSEATKYTTATGYIVANFYPGKVSVYSYNVKILFVVSGFSKEILDQVRELVALCC